jgi:hypothetical protein
MDHAVQISEHKAQNEYAVVTEENGILTCRFKKGLHMDFEIAKTCVQLRMDFSKGRPYPVLVDMRELVSLSKDAREYLASEGSRQITAGALLVSSPLTRTLGNIFLMLNRPPVPTRIFNNEAAAITWLGEFTGAEIKV